MSHPADLVALRFLTDYLEEHLPFPEAEDPYQRLQALTAMRARNTVVAVGNGLAGDSTAQASMLCRSLFEDMIVGHWLAVQDDPSFLVARFFDHQDAMAVYEHDYVTQTMGLPYLGTPIPEALERRDELVRSFGRHAEKSWWGVRPDGKSITIEGIVTVLEDSGSFVPRLSGGHEPVLRNTFSLANKWANQHLHHTGVSLPFELMPDGTMRRRDRDHLRHLTAFSAYWIFGQVIYLQLELQGAAATAQDFDPRFRGTLADTFGDGETEEEATAALAQARRDRERRET